MLLLWVMSAVMFGTPVAGRRQHSLRFGDVFRIQFNPDETTAESLRDEAHRSDSKEWIEYKVVWLRRGKDARFNQFGRKRGDMCSQ
jgi:hypothetical protein